MRVRTAPDADVSEPLTHTREGVAAQRAAECGAGEHLDVSLAMELRVDVAELLLAVDHLRVVPLERALDGVQVCEVAHREVALEVAFYTEDSGFAEGDVAFALRCGEFGLQEDDL